MRFSANLVFLWNDVPFMERFGRAAAAGFSDVEYMFPLEHPLEDLKRELDRFGLRQELFNLPAGDFAAGERGIAVDPDRREEFRAGVEGSLEAAEVLSCTKINCLVGLKSQVQTWERQYATLVENLGWAADRLGSAGVTLSVELLNPIETPRFFLDSMQLVNSVLRDVASRYLKFQLDVYHLQRTQGDLVATIRAVGDDLGHVQIADSPDRHEPGTGEINYRYVLQEIVATGYAGCVGLEYHPSGRTEDSFKWISELGYRLEREAV